MRSRAIRAREPSGAPLRSRSPTAASAGRRIAFRYRHGGPRHLAYQAHLVLLGIDGVRARRGATCLLLQLLRGLLFRDPLRCACCSAAAAAASSAARRPPQTWPRAARASAPAVRRRAASRSIAASRSSAATSFSRRARSTSFSVGQPGSASCSRWRAFCGLACGSSFGLGLGLLQPALTGQVLVAQHFARSLLGLAGQLPCDASGRFLVRHTSSWLERLDWRPQSHTQGPLDLTRPCHGPGRARGRLLAGGGQHRAAAALDRHGVCAGGGTAGSGPPTARSRRPRASGRTRARRRHARARSPARSAPAVPTSTVSRSSRPRHGRVVDRVAQLRQRDHKPEGTGPSARRARISSWR